MKGKWQKIAVGNGASELSRTVHKVAGDPRVDCGSSSFSTFGCGLKPFPSSVGLPYQLDSTNENETTAVHGASWHSEGWGRMVTDWGSAWTSQWLTPGASEEQWEGPHSFYLALSPGIDILGSPTGTDMLPEGRDWRLEVLALNYVKCGAQTPGYRRDSGKEGQFSAYRSPETEGMACYGGHTTVHQHGSGIKGTGMEKRHFI